jgi:hypothetical protein
MSNVIELMKGDRKVLIGKDNVALYGAVLGTIVGKPHGVTRFGALKDPKVAAVLQSRKITKEADQVAEIGKAFTNLQSRGFVSIVGDKVQSATLINDFADLAQEVMQMADKIELPKVEGGKRGRPAGSGKAATGKGNSVKRNPAPAKAKRFSLIGGKVIAWSIGKPSKDQRLSECDENGKIIADIAAINAAYAEKEAKTMKVKRNPKQAATLRYYLKDGVVTPFGRGKPGFDKVFNECTQAGEKIDNSSLVAAMRQPKVATAAKSSKITELETQIAQMAEMMKVMQQMMMGAAIPQQVQAVTVPAPVAQVAKVEVAQVTEKVEKPAKAPKAAKVQAKPAKAAKVSKAKAKSQDDEDIDENDAYANFASISGDLGDDDPIAFGSDGFVVTEIDY